MLNHRITCCQAFRPFALTAAMGLLFILGLQGQDTTGRVVGVVTDPAGASVPDVSISVVNTKTGETKRAASGQDGAYQVLFLPVGTYRVEGEKTGFRKIVTEPMPLSINQSLRFDLKLEIGAASETIQVEASSTGIETVNATLSQTVAGGQVQSLPLNGRNVLDLAMLQPGVTPSSPGSTGQLGFNISGGRRDSVSYILDGNTNNNLLNNSVVLNPNPDAIEEFKILTSTYNAEYGRNAGGAISVVTKSGTNQFHGSAYDYLRNDALNANLFFNNQQDLPRQVLKRNQFGGTLGGPIKKDKLFFFFSYQGQRQSSTASQDAVRVYTPSELKGDFSRSGSDGGPDPLVVDFLNNNPYFQGNPTLRSQGIIDPARIDPIAQKYITGGMVPSAASGTVYARAGATANVDEYTPKIDYNPTDRDHISLTLGWNKSPILDPFRFSNVTGFPITNETKRLFGSVSWTRTITPSLINDLRFGAQRNDGLQGKPARDLPNASALGIGITPDEATGPPNIEFNSGMALGFSVQGPTRLVDNTYILQDTLSWVKGRHTLKGGFYTNAYQNNTKYDFYINGDFIFYGEGGVGSGNDLADFLFGLPDEYVQFPAAPSNIRSKHYSGFFQDEWHVARNLVLTLGIRYEYSTPKRDLQNRSFSLGYGRQSQVFVNAPKGLLFPGDANAPDGANFPDRNDWAPRVGFAWSPGTDGKTSIRGGFGVFYDILKAEDNLQFNGQAPFYGFVDLGFPTLDGNPTGPLNYLSAPFTATGAPNPFPSKPPAKDIDFDASGFLPVGGSGVYYVDPHLRTPYVLQYNFSIQRELFHDVVLNTAYVGSQSRKLTGLIDANPFILGTSQRMFNAQPGVPSYAFSYLDEFHNVGNGNYNSLQFGTTVRDKDLGFAGKMDFFQFSYTWQKSMDYVSGFRESSARVPYYNHGQFYAPSDFDLNHNITVSAGWELPFAKAWASGPKGLLGGWKLYPIFSWHTGFPLDIGAQISRTRTRTGPSAAGDPNLVRADLVGGGVTTYDPKTGQTLDGASGNFYFNPANFSRDRFLAAGFDPVNNPSQRTYGTLGRNAFRGPGYVNLDLALSKWIPIHEERVGAEFRVEAFNLANHANFSNPNTNITSSLFGQVTSTLDPRILQLALRLRF